jgi:hypothetical protein
MVSGTRRTRRDAALLLAVVAFSGYLRVRFVGRAYWGVDEAAPLWLATALRDGEASLLGLPSSTGVPHPAGATLFLIPFAWLRDLTQVSIALSLTQLLALVALGWQLGRNLGSRIWAIALLTCFPALLGVSLVPRNQYLCVVVEALLLALLVRLWESGDSPRVRALEASAAALLSLLQPAIHIAWFPQAVIHCAAIALALARHRATLAPMPLVAGLGLALLPVAWLYGAWLPAAVAAMDTRAALRAWPFAFALVALVCSWRGRRRLQALLRRERAICRAVGLVGLLSLLGALVSITGPTLTRWPLRVLDPVGLLFAAAQALLLAPAVPAVLRRVRGADSGGLSDTPNFLLWLGGACLLAGLGVAPRLFAASGRVDLLHALLLAPLAAFALLSAKARAMRFAAGGLAAVFLLGCALLAPGDALWRRYDYFVPPDEMREVVDWIAERHRTRNPGESVDVRYALALRREWVPGFARRHAAPFYTVGRPFDWLLRQRHGMRNANEGRYERGGSGAFEVRYRRDLEAGAEGVQRFEHVAVRWNASPRSPH